MTISRREFSRLVLGSGTAATAGALGLTAAVAQAAPDYRAVVALYLNGGNDGFNTIVPTDDARYAAYVQARGASLALPRDRLVRLYKTVNGVQVDTGYGLHPSM